MQTLAAGRQWTTTLARNPDLTGIPSAMQRKLLASDGSLTALLADACGGPIGVDLVGVSTTPSGTDRIVWLTGPTGRRVAHATSRWRPTVYHRLGIAPDEPIGRTLTAAGRVMLRRVINVVGVDVPELWDGFGARPDTDGALIYGRDTLLLVDGEHAAVITEMLSPTLT